MISLFNTNFLSKDSLSKGKIINLNSYRVSVKGRIRAESKGKDEQENSN